MDCLSFRRSILADPGSNDDAIVEHADGCKHCRDFRADIRRLDASIIQAIKIPVPESLPAKILLRQSNRPRRASGWRWAIAIAACCVVAIGIGLRSETAESPAQWLGAVKRYVDRSGISTDPAAQIAHRDLNEILNRIGVHMDESIGTVTAAIPCRIGNRAGAHLVITGDGGPVTVLIMPEADLPQIIEFKTAKSTGVIAPCPRGSIAIVGGATAPINSIKSKVEKAISFI